MQHQCSRLIRPSICLRRTFVSSSSSHYPRAARPSPKPWFVEEDAGSGRFPSPTSQGSQTHSSLSPPPPTEAPKPLHTLHSHLSTLPLLQSVTVLRASALDELRGMDEPLPSRKPHGKRNRGAVSFGGDGVGDPPPLWDWVVYAEVKEGAEKRGAVDAVIRSALKTLSKDHPELSLPSKSASRNTDDGWGFVDLGSFSIHVLSKEAKAKWFSGGDKPVIARSFERWF